MPRMDNVVKLRRQRTRVDHTGGGEQEYPVLLLTVPITLGRIIESKIGQYFECELTESGIFYRYVGPEKPPTSVPRWAKDEDED